LFAKGMSFHFINKNNDCLQHSKFAQHGGHWYIDSIISQLNEELRKQIHFGFLFQSIVVFISLYGQRLITQGITDDKANMLIASDTNPSFKWL
jgi:hypothetical protein